MTTNAKRNYTIDANNDHELGTVYGHTTRTFSIDIAIDPIDEYQHENANEFVLTVNGRVVKRMNEYAARRMGVIK